MTNPKNTANSLLKRYGKKGAILYCRGRLDQAKFVFKKFDDNGSSAILRDWESVLSSPVDFYEDVLDILEGKKTIKQRRDGVSLEELCKIDLKELKIYLGGFELYQYIKKLPYDEGLDDLKVFDFFKVDFSNECAILRIFEKGDKGYVNAVSEERFYEHFKVIESPARFLSNMKKKIK